MNIVKCANGHFFDSETYKLCPHCGAPVGTASATGAVPPQPPKKEKKGLFGGLGSKKQKDTRSIQPGWGAPPQPPYGQGQYGEAYNENYQPTGPVYTSPGNMNQGPRTEDVPIKFDQPNAAPSGNAGNWNQGQQSGQNTPVTGGKTLDFWQTASGGSLKQPEAAAEPVPAAAPAPEASVPAPEPAPVPSPAPLPEAAPAPETEKPVNSLLHEVRQASASDEGKTLSYFSAVTAAAAAAPAVTPAAGAAAAPAAPKAIDPVVGWLVSIEGPHFGDSFAIHSGMNSIGRNTANRIVLDRDMAVSREKHAFITYEPKHRQFYVKPGDSSGLVYVNEEYITENRQIKPREVLEIGSSKLVFVPFCTEEFGWEDVLNK